VADVAMRPLRLEQMRFGSIAPPLTFARDPRDEARGDTRPAE